MAKKKATAETPANGQQRPAPAYFLSLSLENVRCFGPKQTLDLSDGHGKPARWTVLLGENGVGKTTVLRSIAFSCVRDDDLPDHARQDGEYVVSLFTIPSVDHLRLVRNAEVAKASYVLTTNGEKEEGSVRVGWNHDRRVFEARYPEGRVGRVDPPLHCGYGAQRRLGVSTVSEKEASGATSTLFNDGDALLNAEEWLARLDYSSSKPSRLQERGKLRLRQIIELLISVLPEVEDIRFIVEGDVVPTARVEFETPYSWVPMRQLGYGYQTVIAWMVDLASRMVERYPDSPDPLAEPVIVLVDEIDLHLHPTWQRSLIQRLDERFPKAQFIVTAHSPLVVQAAPNANLAVLRREGDHVVIDNDVDSIRNWRVDQILTSELFGLPTARPPRFEKDMERRSRLLRKPKLTAAEQREVKELEAKIGPLSVGERQEDIEMMEELRAALAVIKELPRKP